jgi:hypothetical protein
MKKTPLFRHKHLKANWARIMWTYIHLKARTFSQSRQVYRTNIPEITHGAVLVFTDEICSWVVDLRHSNSPPPRPLNLSNNYPLKMFHNCADWTNPLNHDFGCKLLLIIQQRKIEKNKSKCLMALALLIKKCKISSVFFCVPADKHDYCSTHKVHQEKYNILHIERKAGKESVFRVKKSLAPNRWLVPKR